MNQDINVVGIDIAKRVFHVIGMDQRGKIILRKRLYRGEVMACMAQLPRATVGLEACGGAHYWARQLRQQGHEVKLMAPQYVKPYVKSNKNDMRDAEAISEAVTRPSMRFVPVKEVAQQVSLSRLNHRLPGCETHQLCMSSMRATIAPCLGGCPRINVYSLLSLG